MAGRWDILGISNFSSDKLFLLLCEISVILRSTMESVLCRFLIGEIGSIESSILTTWDANLLLNGAKLLREPLLLWDPEGVADASCFLSSVCELFFYLRNGGGFVEEMLLSLSLGMSGLILLSRGSGEIANTVGVGRVEVSAAV